MEAAVYRQTYDLEDGYWWFVGLRSLLLSYIDDRGRDISGLRILDAGCGTGKMLEECRRRNAWGLELAEEGVRFARRRAPGRIVRGSVCSVPFRDGYFDVITCTDVLYHLGVEDDETALREFHRVLAPGGILLLHLPALEAFRRGHDAAVHTRKRYRKEEVRAKLTRTGFDILTVTYRNSFALMAAILKQLCCRAFPGSDGSGESDLAPLPGPLNASLTGLLKIENRLIRAGLPLPFGLSVFGLARKG